MRAAPMTAKPTAPEHELDRATINGAARGERDASKRFVEVYQARVFALVSRMLAGRGRAVVEDVAQETFLQAFQRLRSFDARGTAKLSTWLLTIAARRAIDELRKQRPVLLAEIDVANATGSRADDRAVRRELVAAIESALRELTPELRAAFLLREYHGLEYSEIASALDIDIGTVKSRLSRARAALRERLQEVRHG